MTGSESMTSATVIPASCSVKRVCASVPRAAEASSQPSAANQIAVERVALDEDDEREAAERSAASRSRCRSCGEARRRWRSPVTFQATARAIRPPSSGKAGTRLNTSSSRFIETSSETTTSTGVASAAPESRAASQNESTPGEQDRGGRAEDDEQEGHRRAGDRDAELGARRVGVAAHLHHAAEQEEVDPLDRDPLAAGGERVAELVGTIEAKKLAAATTATT